MKRFLKIAFMAIIGLGIVVFNGCKKDTENTDLKSQTSLKTKSMGNHQQPTQVIEINTTINIQNVEYPVNGNAVVGNFDGRVYECDVMWVVHLDEINEDFPLHLTASLRPEFEDLMTEVDPLIENYIIEINGIHIEPNFILVENGIEVVDYDAIFELWTIVVPELYQNTIIDEIGEEILMLSRQTGVNIFHLSELGLMDDFDNYYSEELFIIDGMEDTLLFIENLKPLANYMTNLCSQVSSLYPSFDGLTDEQRALVLAEVRYFSEVQANGGEPLCFGKLENERNRSINRAALTLAVTTACWIGSATGGPILAGLATTGLLLSCSSYCDTWYSAWALYHLKGGTEPRPRSVLCDER